MPRVETEWWCPECPGVQVCQVGSWEVTPSRDWLEEAGGRQYHNGRETDRVSRDPHQDPARHHRPGQPQPQPPVRSGGGGGGGPGDGCAGGGGEGRLDLQRDGVRWPGEACHKPGGGQGETHDPPASLSISRISGGFLKSDKLTS